VGSGVVRGSGVPRPAIIVPLETGELLRVAAVLSNVSPFLKNLACAGFFYAGRRSS